MDQFFCALAQYAVHIYCLWAKYEKIGEKVTAIKDQMNVCKDVYRRQFKDLLN